MLPNWVLTLPTLAAAIGVGAHIVYVTIWLVRLEGRVGTHEAECARNRKHADERHERSLSTQQELKELLTGLSVHLQALSRLDPQVADLRTRFDYFMNDANNRLTKIADQVTGEVARLTDALVHHGVENRRK